MDFIPDILVSWRHKIEEDTKERRGPKSCRDDRCIITGKIARYRDPKTGKTYHDVTAFKELRRRLEAGEPLEQDISSATLLPTTTEIDTGLETDQSLNSLQRSTLTESNHVDAMTNRKE